LLINTITYIIYAVIDMPPAICLYITPPPCRFSITLFRYAAFRFFATPYAAAMSLLLLTLALLMPYYAAVARCRHAIIFRVARRHADATASPPPPSFSRY